MPTIDRTQTMTQNNPQNLTIYAPNVYLFAYHLCNPLTSESNSPVESAQLWHKCDEILQKLAVGKSFTDSLSKTNEPAGYRANLIDKQAVGGRNSLGFDKQISLENQEINLKGFAQALRIDDSYALGLKIALPEKVNGAKTPAVSLSIFKELNPDNCLLPDFVGSYFGQTLLLTAWLSVEQNQAAREDSQFLKNLAGECLEKFIAGDNLPTFYRQGELFGSPILEYSNPTHPEAGCHVIVWFFNNSATDDIWDEQRYSDFVDLFLYRNKVLRAYQDTRKTYLVTREEYRQIEQNIDKTFAYLQRDKASKRQLSGAGLNKEELAYLETQLLEIPPKTVKYARMLIDLEFRQNTIAINAKNYRDKLQQISLDINGKKKYNNGECDLRFLENFTAEVCPQLEAQIKADLGYLKHGTELLDKSMEAIRGVVAIEQAYRDAKLEVTIQAVGFGVGVAGVVASSAPYLIKEEAPKWRFAWSAPGEELHPFVLVLLISIGAGLGVALLVLFGGKLKRAIDKIKQWRFF